MTEPKLSNLVRLVCLAATHVLIDAQDQRWLITGYGPRGLNVSREDGGKHVSIGTIETMRLEKR